MLNFGTEKITTLKLVIILVLENTIGVIEMLDLEYNYIILMPLSTLLFMLGGKSWKPWRRYILPLLLGIACLINGVVWWRALSYTLMLGVGTSLPYGDSLKVVVYEPLIWLLRLLVFSTLYLPVLVLSCLSWVLALVLSIITFLLFFLSNTKCCERYVPHKVWEAWCGFSIGLYLAVTLCLQ